MNLFKNLSISKKLGFGFLSLTAIIAVVTLITISWVNDIQDQNRRIVELRVPTSQSSQAMINGINHALAALRGWMLIGNEQFKSERALAWRDEIHAPLEQMRKFSKNWTNPDNITKLQRIEELTVKFEKVQKEVEDIAQTRENVPAIKMLFDQAAPQAMVMSKNITKMIDLELEQPATVQRKALLGMLADVRGTLGLGLANIRAFLLSGDQTFREKFGTLWAKNTRRFNDLSSNRELLSPDQSAAFQDFSRARNIFDPLPRKMLTMRAQPDWNLGNYWLRERPAHFLLTLS